MAQLPAIDLARIAQGLGLPQARVETVVELLDAGNTVPFITRYRKDQTGGLDEEQLRQIEQRIVKARLLADRQQTILRSIDSQGQLTPELRDAILAADTTKRLEDLYLPFKPKKQTLATLARERGLEPLALEILRRDDAALDLDARAKDFVNPDKKVMHGADALLGAGHILAEMFAERADLRGKLRAIFESTGTLATLAIEPEVKPEAKKDGKSGEAAPAGPQQTMLWGEDEATDAATKSDAAPATESSTETDAPAEVASSAVVDAIEATHAESDETVVESIPAPAVEHRESDEQPADAETATESEPVAVEPPGDVALAATGELAHEVTSEAAAKPGKRKKEKPKKKEAKKDGPDLKAFRDYFNYREAVANVPPHRILAINRGERAKALRVKIDFDLEAMYAAVDELLVPGDHPHAVLLRGCARDALDRLVLPSLEREVRRELTDRAEAHAVSVFARNLRNLLLQPPVRGRRLLAIDPGYKSGCKLVALDEFGNLIEHSLMHIIGKEERRQAGRAKIVEMIKNHSLNTIVIGNGTGGRETERVVSDIIATELADQNVTYVIVNEAGASVYSASRLGREEFPTFDATVRGGVSIGRRLLDPLSELVKIEPPSLGVGMYQHDIKANHLRNSLDAVVESCVNFVGVDLNTASPALLRYVSGLNQLTAQRIYDHRQQHGPFKAREQLKSVTGIGDGTYVQAAGFLKIVDGDNPLDVTWIHPESYAIAQQILSKVGFTPSDLLDKEKVGQLAERLAQLDVEQLAGEINVGAMTLRDILAQLARPGRDPREALPAPIFKKGVLKVDDLSPGMELDGTVLNVVDFGAFVDIGLKDSGLVHISQLAGRYVQDPHQVAAVGDIVKVWVLEVDKQRRRVSLTMIKPGTRREGPPGRGGDGERGPRPPRGPRRRGGQGQGGVGQPQVAGQPGGPEGGEGAGAPGAGQGQGAPRRDRRPPRRGGRPAGAPQTAGNAAGGAAPEGGAPPQQSHGGDRGGPPRGGRPQGGGGGGRPGYGGGGGGGGRPGGGRGPGRPAFTGQFGGG
ncbi:MAG: helix-hairpin-helix domain-containing protein, partial [Planctomycetaceae bacterium]|nr:helix-hairpin-helix domain-containing protein [Planctomycetaceae bacterium]